ncbi:MAG: hypothetical protein ACK4UO_09360 [Pseudolabrys sp.]
MDSDFRHRAGNAGSCWRVWLRLLPVVACAIALAGCNQGAPSAAAPRGATVAFDSIDGPPSGQFQKLVQNLNEEAQARRLAVIARNQTAAYRVRGYLAAKVVRDRTTIAWVWDVFDRNEQRALRISGEETAKTHPRDAWNAADDAMLRRIARASMEQLAAFVTSPEVAPSAPAEAAAPAQVAAAYPNGSPEQAGIFRVFNEPAAPAESEAAPQPAAADAQTAVPTPRRRPAHTAAADTLTLSATSRH